MGDGPYLHALTFGRAKMAKDDFNSEQTIIRSATPHSDIKRHKLRSLLRRFRRDESGNYVIIAAVAMPVFVGMAAYGTEEGLLMHTQKSLQHAADAAATTAAVAVSGGANDKGRAQAKAVAATYGFVAGQNQTTVAVNSPPASGPNKSNAGAIEVIVSQVRPRLFTGVWGSRPYIIRARAVSVPQGQPCVLALNPLVSGAYSEQGSVTVNLTNCAVIDDSANSSSALNVGGSSRLSTSFVGVVGAVSGNNGITATNGIVTGYRPVPDPYASVNYPSYSGCDQRNYSTTKDATISAGVYCGGITVKSQAHVSLNPGIYYLDTGGLTMAGQSSLTGTGVTLVFTSSSGSNYSGASITGGASINLSAPTTGPTAGIVVFGDRRMPVTTSFKFAGGDSQYFTGAVYVSKGALQWAGNSSASQPCTQIIADTIQMVGNSSLQVNCAGYATKAITTPATLLE
jgi:Flp pilus assembly protein TadG